MLSQTELITRNYDFITLESVKQNANILPTDTSNDDYLTLLIKVVTDYIASKKGEISTAQKKLIISFFNGSNQIQIDDINVKEIVSIEFSDGIERSYKLESGLSYSKIHFENSIPDMDKITITYNCGLTNTDERYKHAVRIGVCNYFDTNRSNYSYNTIDNKVLEKLINIL